jgi:hypothetical protein
MDHKGTRDTAIDDIINISGDGCVSSISEGTIRRGIGWLRGRSKGQAGKGRGLNNNMTTVVTLGVKGAVIRRFFHITQGIIPMLGIIKGVIKNSRIPIGIGREDDMR